MHEGTILVTGACGQIGQELCKVLRSVGREFLGVDSDRNNTSEILKCDLTSQSDLLRIFRSYPIRAVVHLAAILPSAFEADPLLGADVNLRASCELLKQAAAAHIKRFIFASSMSVYGTLPTNRPMMEEDRAAPDDPYGAAKLAVELIGQTLGREKTFEFVALRIARVVGPGIKKSSSPWRSQIFEANRQDSVSIPFAPEAVLSLVHVQDVAQMLFTLIETPAMSSFVYNTPVELWEAGQLKQAIAELRGIRVELGPARFHGGPICNGSRFAREFGFQLKDLRKRLSS